jgi:hypothetical protein
MARSLFKTDDSIATPCSVNTYGSFRRPPLFPGFDIAICDIKAVYSSADSRNMKSTGKRMDSV